MFINNPRYDLLYNPVLRFEDRPEIPLCLDLNIHNFCNAHCDICVLDKLKLNNCGKMDWDFFIKIIDNYKQIGGGVVTFCQNGELFCLEEVFDYLNYVISKNLKIYFVTNASLLSSNKINQLKEINFVGKIYISFHGIRKKTYEKSTGLDYDKTLENINLLIKTYKKNIVFVRSLSHNFENGEEEEVLKYWNEREISVLIQKPHNWAGEIKLEKEDYLCKKEYCTQPLNQMCVDFNGDVYLCCMDMRKKLILGNLNKENIEDIWNGSSFKETLDYIYNFRRRPKGFICNSCSY